MNFLYVEIDLDKRHMAHRYLPVDRIKSIGSSTHIIRLTRSNKEDRLTNIHHIGNHCQAIYGDHVAEM